MKNFVKAIYFVLWLLLLPLFSYTQGFSPDTIYTDNITVNSADLNWNNSSNVNYYRVSYREQGQGSWMFASSPVNIPASTNQVNLTGLNDNTVYEWRIKTWCLDGTFSSWSTSANFTTVSAFPLDCNGDQN